jgi:hypothetical protein
VPTGLRVEPKPILDNKKRGAKLLFPFYKSTASPYAASVAPLKASEMVGCG